MVLNTIVATILRYRFAWVDYVEFSGILKVPTCVSNLRLTICLVFRRI